MDRHGNRFDAQRDLQVRAFVYDGFFLHASVLSFLGAYARDCLAVGSLRAATSRRFCDLVDALHDQQKMI